MKTAFIMIGIQGSGKSEFCRRCLPDVERINLDTLGTRKNEMRVIAACQARGIDYVIDNTNHYHRGELYYLFVLIGLVLVLYGFAYYFISKIKNPSLRYFPVAEFLSPVLA